MRLIHGRDIRSAVVEGIAHVPSDALDGYRAAAS
jgi:hypothetical protein